MRKHPYLKIKRSPEGEPSRAAAKFIIDEWVEATTVVDAAGAVLRIASESPKLEDPAFIALLNAQVQAAALLRTGGLDNNILVENSEKIVAQAEEKRQRLLALAGMPQLLPHVRQELSLRMTAATTLREEFKPRFPHMMDEQIAAFAALAQAMHIKLAPPLSTPQKPGRRGR